MLLYIQFKVSDMCKSPSKIIEMTLPVTVTNIRNLLIKKMVFSNKFWALERSSHCLTLVWRTVLNMFEFCIC